MALPIDVSLVDTRQHLPGLTQTCYGMTVVALHLEDRHRAQDHTLGRPEGGGIVALQLRKRRHRDLADVRAVSLARPVDFHDAPVPVGGALCMFFAGVGTWTPSRAEYAQEQVDLAIAVASKAPLEKPHHEPDTASLAGFVTQAFWDWGYGGLRLQPWSRQERPTIGALLEIGLLTPGEMLHGAGSYSPARAIVQDNGTLLTEQGEFRDPTTAARRVAPEVSTGWEFWCREDEHERSLAQLWGDA